MTGSEQNLPQQRKEEGKADVIDIESSVGYMKKLKQFKNYGKKDWQKGQIKFSVSHLKENVLRYNSRRKNP